MDGIKFGVPNDINVVIQNKEKGVLLDDDCCTVINIMLTNEGKIATSFLGTHNPFIVSQLEKAQKEYFKVLKKTLKKDYKEYAEAPGFDDEECDCGCGIHKKDVSYDETLHIPHNSSAYTRSRTTAKALLNDGASAIFDIHRDGASRSFYLTEYKGKKYSKIRLVVGQNNPNSEANLQFALWLVSVADTLYPWLIADIYMGSGRYNQDLSAKAMLFEMGCHKIEKDYVKNSVPLLADVIYTTLFATIVEEESGNLTVGGVQTENQGASVDEVLDQKNPPAKGGKVWFFIVGGVGVAAIMVYIIRKKRA